jgi:hypothetical protein
VRFYADNTLQEPPLRLLPCTELERATKAASGANAPAANKPASGVNTAANNMAAGSPTTTKKFRISGELSEYKGRRYLLLRKVQVERDMGQL